MPGLEALGKGGNPPKLSDDGSLPELWLALEDAFDIELDDDDVSNVRTARDVVDVVRVRLTDRGD